MSYFDASQIGEPFTSIASRLRADVAAAEARLRALSESDAAAAPSQGKWSAKEIIGQLVDSASNNHHRFERAQLAASLRLPGYEQGRWVFVQRYQDRAWNDLIALWSAYNRHLAHVIATIPEDRRHVSCEIGGDAQVTLEYVVLDYVGHIHHHLRQVFR
jgi:hypothetical protein